MKIGARLESIRRMWPGCRLNMPARRRSVGFLTAVLLWFAPVARPQTPKQPESGAQPGMQLFASNCSACHGIDGKGSERAPNIADSPQMKQRSNAEIFGIIHDGVPGTGMPAFHALTDAQTRTLVEYLRGLEGPAESVRTMGDARHGKNLFSGKAECSRCHMIAGEGGFAAQDLSEYARDRTGDQIKTAIVHPVASGRQVSVTLRTGQKLEGRLRNEDNFSIQLQTGDGAFHSLKRSDVERIESAPDLRMPTDYGAQLNPAEINDLIAYLTEAASSSKAAIVKKPKRDYQDEP